MSPQHKRSGLSGVQRAMGKGLSGVAQRGVSKASKPSQSEQGCEVKTIFHRLGKDLWMNGNDHLLVFPDHNNRCLLLCTRLSSSCRHLHMIHPHRCFTPASSSHAAVVDSSFALFRAAMFRRQGLPRALAVDRLPPCWCLREFLLFSRWFSPLYYNNSVPQRRTAPSFLTPAATISRCCSFFCYLPLLWW